ncbi:fd0cca7a-cc59-4a19-8483-a8bf0419b1ff [Sclerotinia trifoliorum]|uniref:Fd0cca7a-cc59-4a19-8483-a8bf0419b1ff n=1 Tax=Sclerotinia trifoliorum TaxID=28548 RepID=A0A8H2ZT11_9HELO|nr:fd0cca7a-cc59-4a19-8483-a8bf0419b1ff [Sclerotinia trifoliorum]
MTINALSESTIHLLGSSQVLTTPTSLIKELIDNALDAKATCIDILISQNTIDKIEVRDNGDGIQLGDLDALGRRGHTSKLTTFTELRNLGGRSLGFRGEALASACQLGDVSITTKTDGQPVGTCVKLKAMGGIQSQSRTSHPIGTTVCVMNFMSKLPVRKQTALKEAPKTIGKIQQLVQRYALARVSIKLTLKIVKGAKGAWSYAPRPHGGIKDSVSLVIGRDTALQCSETSMIFSDSPDLHEGSNVPSGLGAANGVPASHFCLEAFLPRNDADPNKLGKGQYLSVDSRPVASEKGTMKKIITIFKKYLRSVLTAESSLEKIKSPFIRLNIVCPEASYDPNVEPAKDDIIFENEKLVLEAAERMFKNFYGECDTVISRLAKNNIETNSAGFDILLARNTQQDFPTPSAIVDPPLTPKDTHFVTSSNSIIMSNVGPATTNDASSIAEPENSEVSEEPSALRMNRKWGCDMSQDYTEYTDDFCRRASVNHMQNQYSFNSNQQPIPIDLNPWIIAKMTAPIQDETATSSSTINTNSSSNILLNSIKDDSLQVMSPRRVTAAVSSPQSRRIDKPNASIADILQSHSNFRRHVHESRMQSADFTDPMTQNDLPVINHRHSHLNINGFTTATNLVETSLMSPPNTSPNMQQQKKTGSQGLNKPFIPPFRTPNSSGVSVGLVQTQLKLPHQPFIVQREASDPPIAAATSDPETQQTNFELEWAMDFEHRKEDATRRRRDELQAMRELSQQQSVTGQTSSRQSPHKNRYNAALASLGRPTENLEERSSETNTSGVKTSLPDSDPRGYLMKRQKSFSVLSSITGGPRKLKRAQTLRLPLESIPVDLETRRLLQTVPSGIDSISKLVMETSKQDTYVRRGIQAIGLEMTATDREAVGKKLYQVVEAWMNLGRGEKCDVEFEFGGLGSLHGA